MQWARPSILHMHRTLMGVAAWPLQQPIPQRDVRRMQGAGWCWLRMLIPRRGVRGTQEVVLLRCSRMTRSCCEGLRLASMSLRGHGVVASDHSAADHLIVVFLCPLRRKTSKSMILLSRPPLTRMVAVDGTKHRRSRQCQA